MSEIAVGGGRAMAERQMTDTFTIYRPNGTSLDASGMETPAYAPVGSTLGKIQSRSSGLGNAGDTTVRTQNVGGVDRPVIEAGIHVPVDSPAPVLGSKGVGWEYVLTTPGPSTPAELIGSRWLVVDSPAKSAMTARRLDVVRLP